MPWGRSDFIFIMICYSFRYFPKHNISYFEYAFTLNQCWKCEQREKQQIRYLKWGRWRSSSAKSRRHIFCFLRSAPEKLLIWGKRPQSARSVLSARVSRKMQSSGCKRCPHCPGGACAHIRWYIITRGCKHWEGHSCTQFGTHFQPMVAQCCTLPPTVPGVHTFGSRWCLGLNSTRLASQLFHFYCKRPQPPRPQVEGWWTVLKLGWLHCRFFSPIHNWMCHM